MAAGRTIRRAPAAQAVPALLQAVSEHADGFIRFRALILLTGFNDPRTADAMEAAMASPNDRLREVAYAYFEQNPEPPLAPQDCSRRSTRKKGSSSARRWCARWPRCPKDPKVTEALVRDSGARRRLLPQHRDRSDR